MHVVRILFSTLLQISSGQRSPEYVDAHSCNKILTPPRMRFGPSYDKTSLSYKIVMIDDLSQVDPSSYALYPKNLIVDKEYSCVITDW